MARASTTPPADEARSTRDTILDVAEHQFAARGFSGVSMRAIAAEAGLRNQASLYHYFRNKRALYEAALARGLAPIVDLVRAGGEAPRDEIVDRLVDVLVEHPNLPRLIQRAGLDDSRHFGKTLARLLEPLYRVGLQVLEGKGASWPASDLPHLAAGIYHVIFGYFADAAWLQTVLGEQLRSPTAVLRQRRFVKQALARLLDDRPGPRLVRSSRRR